MRGRWPLTLVIASSALVTGLVATVTARAEKVECPAETAWDGIACAHPRATCGAWDGTTCGPPPAFLAEERATEAEFARIDGNARAICPEDDDARQVYSGSVGDVLKGVDLALGRATAIEARLEDLRDKNPAPTWTVAALARAGSVYDCIWNSLSRSTPTHSPQQQNVYSKLQRRSAQLATAGARAQAAQLQDLMSAMSQEIQGKWLEQRDKYIDVLTAKAVDRYVTADLLARRYALDWFTFTRAHRRLPVVAAALGASRMSAILQAMPDPTAPTSHPEDRRHIPYFDGAFVP